MAPSSRERSPISSSRSEVKSASSRSRSIAEVLAASAISGRLRKRDSHAANPTASSAVTVSEIRNQPLSPR